SVRVEAWLDGHLHAARSVQLFAGSQVVEMKLERAPPPPVSLLLKSDPEGAEVSDGARILGTTPFNWTAPKGETRTLIFRLAGHREVEQRVTLSGNESDLSVRLRRLDASRPAAQREAPEPDSIKLER